MKMSDIDTIKKHYKTHKAAAVALGVSYTRYAEWRRWPWKMPKYAMRLIELESERIKNLPQETNDDLR